MANQIVVSAGAKVRNLSGVLTATSGVVSFLPIDVSLGIPQLDVNGKILVSQLPNSVMEYKGTWSAATNTPTLVNGTGNQGDVYLCNVAGTVNFGAGAIAFFVGDQVIYSGSIWQRASGATGTVTSVAVTETGDSLNITGSPITTSGTINIGFNGTNLQYVNGAGNLTTFPILTGYVTAVSGTAPVVSSGGTTPAISMAAATGSVDGYLSATDFAIFNAKQSALTFSSPLVNTSGTISIPAATTSVNGYLASADFTTFNNKQNAITLTTTGTSGASTLVGATLNIPNYGSALSGYLPLSGGTLTGPLNGTSATFSSSAYFATTSGSVGIGTILPINTLSVGSNNQFGVLGNFISFNAEVNANSDGWINFQGYNAGYTQFRDLKIGNGRGSQIAIFQGSTGSLGIGTSSPAYLLDVNGTARVSGAVTFSSNLTIGTYMGNGGALASTVGFLGAYSGSGSTYEQFLSQFTLQSTTTSNSGSFRSNISTTASAFTLTNLKHFEAQFNNLGTGSAITNHYGFYANSSLSNAAATNTYGFFGDIASYTNRWNLYMGGTAANYMAGVLSIGSTTIDTTYILDVSGQARVNNYVFYRLTGGANYYRVGILAGTANFEIYNTNYGRSDLLIIQSTGAATFSSTLTTGGITGIAVSPSPNTLSNGSIDLLNGAGMFGYLNKNYITANMYYNTAWLYKATAAASLLNLTDGGMILYGAPSGTAGTGITLTQLLSIASTGAATFSSSVTATAFIPSGATVPTNGMYLSAANTLNFATASTNRLIINSSGNLGLGVTPSAWAAGKSISVGSSAAFYGDGINYIWSAGIAENAYKDATVWKYVATGYSALRYEQLGDNGTHAWYNAASGTAGNAITFTQAMTLFSTGNLAVGTTTDSGYKLDVNGTGRFSGALTGTTATLISGVGAALSFKFSAGYGNSVIYTSWDSGSDIGNEMTFKVNNAAGTAIQALSLKGTGAATFSSSVNVNGILQVKSTSSSPSIWAGGYGGGITILADNATSNRYLDLSIVDSAGAIASQGIRITNPGNVLIGTTTDSGYKLDVNGQINTNTFYRLMSGATLVGAIGYSSSIFGSGGNNWVFYNSQATDNIFYTNGTERLRIASTGAATFSSSVTATNLILNGTTTTALDLTSGTFSYALDFQNNDFIRQKNVAGTLGLVFGMSTDDNLYVRGFSGINLQVNNGTTALALASTGAATFSNDVTVGSPTTNATLSISGDNGGGDTFLNFKADIGVIKAQIQGGKYGGTSGKLYFKTLQSSVLTTSLTLDQTGAATFSGTLGINGVADNVKSGTYTPTINTTTNIASSSVGTWQYLRVGNTVTVSGSITITPTSGVTTTSFNFSLPINSTFATGNDCAGTGVDYNATTYLMVNGNSGAANFGLGLFKSTTTSAMTLSIQFTYQII